MKLLFQSGVGSRESGAKVRHPEVFSPRLSALVLRSSSGFTLVEIAISLAIIGIALVAIIGVLPLGMTAQRDNREATIINQDATIFMEAIRSGARGDNDLTNYVYAITNTYTGIGYANFFNGPGSNNIVGLLSTPEFTGGTSNRMVAYVHSVSGPAVEKPPQDNSLVVGDSFSYRIVCQNVPVPVDVPLWQAQSYSAGAEVLYQGIFYRATALVGNGDIPGTSSLWTSSSYAQGLTSNLHELRLTFLWPQLPNGGLGGGHQTYRALIAGQLVNNGIAPTNYFFQSQSFTNAP